MALRHHQPCEPKRSMIILSSINPVSVTVFRNHRQVGDSFLASSDDHPILLGVEARATLFDNEGRFALKEVFGVNLKTPKRSGAQQKLRKISNHGS